MQPGAKLPWTIIINGDGVLKWENDKEWVITDTIPKGLVLDENSIKIGCGGWYTASSSSYTATVTKLADGSTKLVITMQPDAFSYTDNGEKKIYKSLTITYNTTLDTTCTDIWSADNTAEFKNVAEFERNGEKKGETSFTEKITRDVVGKSGTFDPFTGLLTYQVKVNPYGAMLHDDNEMVLKDVMNIPDGLQGKVTLEGISVFDGELQADGSLEATNLRTELTRLSGDYDDDKAPVTKETYYSKTNKDSNQIKAWTKVPDGTALVLVFHYRVDTNNLVANTTFTFKNTATLNGKWEYVEQSTNFTSSSSGTAGIDFNTNRLTIVKYSGTQSNVLPGAKFKLQKYDGTNWVTVTNNGKDEIETNASGNATLGALDVNTLYRLLETKAPAGYLLPNPNNYYYFAISSDSNYTPPAAPEFAADTDTYKLYSLDSGKAFDSFYYYCNNTPDETYVVPGKLKVVKKWTDASGNPLTDLTKVPDVKVTLTKSAPAKGHTIYVKASYSTGYTTYCTDIKDGAYIYIGGAGLNLSDVQHALPEGVMISSTTDCDPNNTWNTLCKIGPINRNIEIECGTIYSNMTGNNRFVKQVGGTISDKPVVTTVGTVTLNALNKWTYTWDDLETGEGITYSITEETVTGYKTTYTVTVDGTEKTDTSATAIPIDPTKGTLVTITNTEDIPGYELPSTGGTGTLPYTAVGGTMMLSALAYSFIHRKRRREGRADD